MTETKIDRPAAPEGSIYLQDVLNVLRTFAVRHRWCDDAEAILSEELNVPQHELLRPSFWRGDAYCCWYCNGERSQAEWAAYISEHPEVLVRFVLIDPLRTIEVVKLRAIVRRLAGRWTGDTYQDLFARLIDTFAPVGA